VLFILFFRIFAGFALLPPVPVPVPGFAMHVHFSSNWTIIPKKHIIKSNAICARLHAEERIHVIRSFNAVYVKNVGVINSSNESANLRNPIVAGLKTIPSPRH